MNTKIAEQPQKIKKKKSKIMLKILLIFIIAVAVIALITAVANTVVKNAQLKYAASFSAIDMSGQLVPEKNDAGYWVFTTDNDLKVMQLTDVHIGGGWMSFNKDRQAMRAIYAMAAAEKPDLIIATGDISYPVPFQAGTFNNKSAALIFAEFMNTIDCYWCITYGNHDTEAYSYYSREQLSALYCDEKYSKCLFETGPEDIYGSGNYVITVENSKELTTQALICMDSNTYTDGDILGIKWYYDNIHEDQIAWYKDTVNSINAANKAKGGNDVNSLLFFHIPLNEYKTALTEFADNGYKDTENVKYIYGMAGETGKVSYGPVHEDNMFETILELGSTKGIFCGHDHYNNYSLDYKGVRLTYGMSIDCLAYPGISKEGSQRGCTVITVHTDGSFDNVQKNLYTDGYLSADNEDMLVTFQFDGVTYQYFEEE